MPQRGPIRPSNMRGSASVELAIALPLLLLLMLAAADVGRMLSQYNTLTQAVRGACRYVAAHAGVGSTGIVSITPDLSAAAANLAATGTANGAGPPLLPGLSSANVTVADAGNGLVSVSVSYTYQPLLGAALPSFGLGGPVSLGLPLEAAAIMRAL